ncbi:unnamed protein product [Prorocentrum cordatum]|uniref:DNA-directed DNA polymerase n=1 Tax=Prorocentrum cordatum TaxID=2364126 RepID=A0ABN9R186_9DINO|nr:unnamed protein product [Polarella glacialis]
MVFVAYMVFCRLYVQTPFILSPLYVSFLAFSPHSIEYCTHPAEVENAESNFERLITARRWESLKRHGPGVLETRHLLEARRVDGVADFGSLERAESLDVARGASWCRRAGLPALESKVCHLGEARQPAERASGAARARAEASPRGGKGAPARPSRARAEGAFQKGPIVQLPLRGSERSPVVVRSTGDCGPALQALRSSRGRAGRLFAVSCELGRQGEGAGLVCFTVHGGEGVDFGGSSTLWVDAVSISEEVGQPCALACFREFFEDEGYQKIYHNYSSLNSALHQQGVSHLGFAGDTMHMARLWDASLAFLQNDDVSLPKLTSLCLGSEYAQALTEAVIRKKDGKFVQRPLSLQSGAETRGHWIDFAAWAAVCVFHLYRDLRARLEATPCRPLSGAPPGAGTLWEFYDRYWRPFGQVLAAMERRGVGADAAHLRALENDVLRERAVLEAAVRGWAADATSERFGPDAVEGANLHALNTGSDAQIRHLLFGGVANKMRRQGSLPDEKVLPGVAPPAEEAGPAEAPSAALEGPPAPAGDGGAAAADYSQLKLPELKELLKSLLPCHGPGLVQILWVPVAMHEMRRARSAESAWRVPMNNLKQPPEFVVVKATKDSSMLVAQWDDDFTWERQAPGTKHDDIEPQAPSKKDNSVWKGTLHDKQVSLNWVTRGGQNELLRAAHNGQLLQLTAKQFGDDGDDEPLTKKKPAVVVAASPTTTPRSYVPRPRAPPVLTPTGIWEDQQEAADTSNELPEMGAILIDPWDIV